MCFFNDTATTEIYTLSLHDALPISSPSGSGQPWPWEGARQHCVSCESGNAEHGRPRRRTVQCQSAAPSIRRPPAGLGSLGLGKALGNIAYLGNPATVNMGGLGAELFNARAQPLPTVDH